MKNLKALAEKFLDGRYGAVLLTGSFAQRVPLYRRESGGELVPTSDLDLIVLTSGEPVATRELRSLRAELLAEGFVDPSIGATTYEALERCAPSQLYWELSVTGVSLAGRVPASVFAPFRDYVPTVNDAKRLIVNRFAELMGDASQTAAFTGVRAGVDAMMIIKGQLPANLNDRLSQVELLGDEWLREARLYKEIVNSPMIDHLDTFERDWTGAALTAMRRAAGKIDELERLDVQASLRVELARHRMMLTRRCVLLSKRTESAVHRKLAHYLTCEKCPPPYLLRAWEVIHHPA